MTESNPLTDAMEGLEVEAGRVGVNDGQDTQPDLPSVQIEKTAQAEPDWNAVSQPLKKLTFQHFQSQVGFSFGLIDKLKNQDEGGNQGDMVGGKDTVASSKTNYGGQSACANEAVKMQQHLADELTKTSPRSSTPSTGRNSSVDNANPNEQPMTPVQSHRSISPGDSDSQDQQRWLQSPQRLEKGHNGNNPSKASMTRRSAVMQEPEKFSPQSANWMDGLLTRDENDMENAIGSTSANDLQSKIDSRTAVVENINSNDDEISVTAQSHRKESTENGAVNNSATPSQPTTGPNPPTHKACRTCLQEQPLSQFYHVSKAGIVVKACQSCRKLDRTEQKRVQAKAVELENQRRKSKYGDEDSKETERRCTRCMQIRPLANFRVGAATGAILVTCANCRVKTREASRNHNAGLRKCQSCQQALPVQEFRRAGIAAPNSKYRTCDSCEGKKGKNTTGRSRAASCSGKELKSYRCELCDAVKAIAEFARQGKHFHPCNDCAGRRAARRQLLDDMAGASQLDREDMPAVPRSAEDRIKQYPKASSIMTRSSTREMLLKTIQLPLDTTSLVTPASARTSHKRTHSTDEDESLLITEKSQTETSGSSLSTYDVPGSQEGHATTAAINQTSFGPVLRSSRRLPAERRKSKLEKRAGLSLGNKESASTVEAARHAPPAPFFVLFFHSLDQTL